MRDVLPEQGGREVDADAGGQGDDQLAGEAQPGQRALLRASSRGRRRPRTPRAGRRGSGRSTGATRPAPASPGRALGRPLRPAARRAGARARHGGPARARRRRRGDARLAVGTQRRDRPARRRARRACGRAACRGIAAVDGLGGRGARGGRAALGYRRRRSSRDRSLLRRPSSGPPGGGRLGPPLADAGLLGVVPASGGGAARLADSMPASRRISASERPPVSGFQSGSAITLLPTSPACAG